MTNVKIKKIKKMGQCAQNLLVVTDLMVNEIKGPWRGGGERER